MRFIFRINSFIPLNADTVKIAFYALPAMARYHSVA